MKDTQEIKLTEQVSEHYRKFFNKFNEINTLPITDWNNTHLLAYLCKQYESHYGVKYSFKFNNPAPSKSYEVFQMKKMANMLSSQPQILKDYIDWVFKNKIIEKKKRVTSLAYFTHQDIINDYKFKYLLKLNAAPARSDTLPDNVIFICSRHGLDIKTYAELAFAKKMHNKQSLFEELKSANFQVDVLDRIA